jgi:hypothetical protein
MTIVKVEPTTLTAPFAPTDTQFTVQKFLDSKGRALALSNFGTFIVLVIVQTNTTEIVKCSNFTNNSDGTTTFTVVESGRDLDPTSPYAGYSTGQNFQGGAEVYYTNDPFTMSQFVQTGIANTFTVTPQSTAATVNPTDLVTKSYVDAIVLGALTTIDVVVPGIAGTTIAAGNLIYFDMPSGTWLLATASTAATLDDALVGIAQGAGVLNGVIAGGILLQGDDTHQSGLTVSGVAYASNTPGLISNAAGTDVFVVGIAKTATNLYFAPRFNLQLNTNQFNALAGNSGTPSASNPFVTVQGLSYYGSGADGAVTIASGNTVTLTRDMFYTTLVVNGTLNTGGFRIFCTVSISGTGLIMSPTGNAGAAGVSTSTGASGAGGAGATAFTTGSFRNTAGAAGGIGGAQSGGSQGSGGSNGVGATLASSSSSGASGGNGAEQGSQGGTPTTNYGGTGGSVSNVTAAIGNLAFQTINFVDFVVGVLTGITAPGAGGGGGGNGYNNPYYTGGGGGGGGGASGVLVFIAAPIWAGSFTIQAFGGAGGIGGSGQYQSAGGSGGGGKGGDSIVLYNTKTWTGTYALTGGVSPTPPAYGNVGQNGANGTSFEAKLSNLIR